MLMLDLVVYSELVTFHRLLGDFSREKSDIIQICALHCIITFSIIPPTIPSLAISCPVLSPLWVVAGWVWSLYRPPLVEKWD